MIQDFLRESGLHNPLIQTWEQSKCWLQDRVLLEKNADTSKRRFAPFSKYQISTPQNASAGSRLSAGWREPTRLHQKPHCVTLSDASRGSRLIQTPELLWKISSRTTLVFLSLRLAYIVLIATACITNVLISRCKINPLVIVSFMW